MSQLIASARRLARSLLIILALLVVTPADAGGVKQGSLRRFVAWVYAPYMRPTSHSYAGWDERGMLSPQLHQLYDANVKRVHGDEVIDADPICDCQDWDKFSFVIGRIRLHRPGWLVPVTLLNFGVRHHLTLWIVSGGKLGFRIDDLSDATYRPSLKAWLRRELRHTF